MTEDRRAPTADVIDVFISIDIPNLRAFSARNEKRLTANIAKRTHWRVNARGNILLRSAK